MGQSTMRHEPQSVPVGLMATRLRLRGGASQQDTATAGSPKRRAICDVVDVAVVVVVVVVVEACFASSSLCY
eukprot:8624104-Pyramimonas_sp.AAC.1